MDDSIVIITFSGGFVGTVNVMKYSCYFNLCNLTASYIDLAVVIRNALLLISIPVSTVVTTTLPDALSPMSLKATTEKE